MAITIQAFTHISYYPDGSFDSTFLPSLRGIHDVDSFTWFAETTGTLTEVPIVVTTDSLTGHKVPSFVDDFYDRVHIQPRRINLGNVGSPVTRTIEVWNAFLASSETLNSITKSIVDDSVVLTEPSPTPLVYLPLQNAIYTVDVSDEGPAESFVTYTFDFVSNDIDVIIEAIRLTLLPFMPEDVVEQDFQWLTTVQTAFDSVETTQKLRNIPRESVTFRYRNTFRTAISNTLLAGHSSSIGVPKWIQFTPLITALVINDTQVFCDVNAIDIEEDDTLFIYSKGLDPIFTRVISVQIDHIVIDAIASAFPAGTTYLMKTLVARMGTAVGFSLYPVNAPDFQIKFDSIDYIETPPVDLPLQHVTYDVLEEANLISGNTGVFTSTIFTDLIDYETGIFTYVPRVRNPSLRFRANKFLTSLTDIRDFQKWLFKIGGRSGRFWTVGYSSDIKPQTLILAADTAILIDNIKLKDVVALYTSTFYVYVKLFDGTTFIREVLSITETNALTETLVLATSLGQDINPSEIKIFDRLHFVRLASDTVRFKYERLDQCTVEFEVTETR